MAKTTTSRRWAKPRRLGKGHSRTRAKPLAVGRPRVRSANARRGDGVASTPVALGLALVQTSVRLAGVCLAHPLALATCRSPLDLYRAQASLGKQILEAYRPLLCATALLPGRNR